VKAQKLFHLGGMSNSVPAAGGALHLPQICFANRVESYRCDAVGLDIDMLWVCDGAFSDRL
jgi:hypothetical protein